MIMNSSHTDYKIAQSSTLELEFTIVDLIIG